MQIKLRPGWFVVLGVLCVGLVLPVGLAFGQVDANWKQKWEKVLADAKKEGRVVVFGPPGDRIRNVITQGFKKDFPDIEIEYSGSSGGALATKIRAEREGGIYSVDVVIAGTTTANIQLKPLKALDPIQPSLIVPEVADLKNWRDGVVEFADKEGTYNLVFASSIYPPVIYNPEQVKPEEIDELYELLDPKWKGKILINDPMTPGPGAGIFRHIWQVLGPEKGADYFRRIRAQAGAVDRNNRRMIEWIAQGKYAIQPGPYMGLVHELDRRGLKIGVLPEFKDYGAYITAGASSLAILNRRPNPNATTVFVNWMLSKDAQTGWSETWMTASRRLDVSTAHLAVSAVPRNSAEAFINKRKPGQKYWLSHVEENVRRSKAETAVLKELFGK